MSPAPYRAITLAIHPNSQGFGWVAFTSPLSPYDWGNVGAKGANKNVRCLKRVEKLRRRLTPQTIVLEEFETKQTSMRTANLCRMIVALAAAQGLDVAVYPFRDVRGCFVHMGATSRSEIATVIASQFPELAHHLPRKRRVWEPQPWKLSLFCATALALTHYQRDAGTLLSRLSS